MRRATRRLQLVSIQSYYDNCCVVYSLDNSIHLLLKDLGSWDEENFVKWIAIKCSDVTFNITIFLISDILFNIISIENNSNQGKIFCPLFRGVRLLGCPLIGGSTVILIREKYIYTSLGHPARFSKNLFDWIR